MAPIRTAIIGLSTSSISRWASDAHLPYLLSPRGRERYEVVAVLNSTVESAQKAISTYNLPPGTKAYGDPQALADDKDIDLVVCNTRVDNHYSTILPSIKAGKVVFVEWPLAHDLEHAKELVIAARASGSRTIIGTQGRESPAPIKLRELLGQGRIGKVLSSEVKTSTGTFSRDTIPLNFLYFVDRSVGGNGITIAFGHLIDQIQSVLGELHGLRSRVQLQRPIVKLRDPSTNTIVRTTVTDVPDLIYVHGSLSGSNTVVDGASVLVRFRRGQPFPGEPALSWTINGEKGEIRVQSQGVGAFHGGGYSSPVTIEVHDHETDEVQQVEWNWKPWQEELPLNARSVGALYDNFADGFTGGVPTFETALIRHEQLADVFATWDADKK